MFGEEGRGACGGLGEEYGGGECVDVWEGGDCGGGLGV